MQTNFKIIYFKEGQKLDPPVFRTDPVHYPSLCALKHKDADHIGLEHITPLGSTYYYPEVIKISEYVGWTEDFIKKRINDYFNVNSSNPTHILIWTIQKYQSMKGLTDIQVLKCAAVGWTLPPQPEPTPEPYYPTTAIEIAKLLV